MKIAAALAGLLLSLISAPAHAAGWSIQITSPKNYQTFQRDSSDRATFTVTGWYVGNPRQIQASWNGTGWRTIDNTLTRGKGTFRGTLTGMAGQGTLRVRFSGNPTTAKTYFVGVGDLYVMAGQSNMMGFAPKPHQYTPTNIRAAMLANNDQWAELRDPYDSSVAQVDKVSADPHAKGSWVAWFANAHIRKTGVPLAVIPAAKGGTHIKHWAPSTSRNTLYGSMARRVKFAGGKAKAVLWYQGEGDTATPADSYKAQLSRIADAAHRDFRGAKLIPAIIGPASWSGLSRMAPRMGTIAAVRENPNIEMGPAMYDINLDDEGADGTHLSSERDLGIAGSRFWKAVDHAFYGGETGYGPQLEETTLEGTVVRLRFDTDLTVTANPESFWVTMDGVPVPVLSLETDDNTIELTLETIPTGDVSVSYGHDNRSAIEAAVYNDRGLPAVPFHQVQPEQVEPLIQVTPEPTAEPTVEPTPTVEPSPTPEPSDTPEPTPEVLEGLIPNE